MKSLTVELHHYRDDFWVAQCDDLFTSPMRLREIAESIEWWIDDGWRYVWKTYERHVQYAATNTYWTVSELRHPQDVAGLLTYQPQGDL